MPFLLLFLSLHIQATTIAKIRSAPEGTSVLKFIFEKGTAVQERKTNLFDPERELRLGTFTTNSKLTGIESRIAGLIKGNKAEAGTAEIGHQVFFMVNDQIVSPDSPLHESFEKEFALLQSAEWNFQSGIELSKDLTEIREFKDGKIKEANPFSFSFHCQGPEKNQTCLFKERGFLYVR